MSTSIFDRYLLRISAVSPIHVGTGREYFRYEFHCDVQSRTVSILNIDKLVRKNPVQAALVFKDEKSAPDTATLFRLCWNQKELICNQDQIAGDIAELLANERSTIWEFTKDNAFRPYLPGSSIKGAVRTAIAYWMLKNDPELLNRVKQAVVVKTGSANTPTRMGNPNAVEEFIFRPGGDAKRDLMRLWHFSDSKPLGVDSLSVVAAKRLSSTRLLGFTNFFEVLTKQSGTLELEVLFDQSLAKAGFCEPALLNPFPKTISDLFACINEFTDDIVEFELDYFRNHPERPHTIVIFYENLKQSRKKGKMLLPLGKGTGWIRKTVGLPLREDENFFSRLVEAYKLGKGKGRFKRFPQSREVLAKVVRRNSHQASRGASRTMSSGNRPMFDPSEVFGWAQLEVVK
ncbi:MAG: type III-A CRISPR-associated RAMP protein Csm5 [candidate division WOR-3 bacterium]